MNDYFVLFAIAAFFAGLSSIMAVWVRMKEAQERRKRGEQGNLFTDSKEEEQEHQRAEMAVPSR